MAAVVRIDNRYLSQLCSDKKHGGKAKAYAAALDAAQALQRKARRLARQARRA